MPSVQQVSEDGTPKSEVVGAVDAELVRAASYRTQEQVSGPVMVFFHNLILCMCGFSLFEINFLPRSFVVVGRQR